MLLFVLLTLSLSIHNFAESALECSSATQSAASVYYYDTSCDAQKCYVDQCLCLGTTVSLIANNNGTCVNNNASCVLKNTCAIKFLQCINNVTESNSTASCANKVYTYKSHLSTPIVHYLYCESVMCYRFNFSTCGEDPCGAYLGLTKQTTTQIANYTNSTYTPTTIVSLTTTSAPISIAANLCVVLLIFMSCLSMLL